MRTDHFRDVKRYCAMCRTEIPDDRRKDAITCSKACTKARDNYIRARVDQAKCRYCSKPSTPEDRQRFKMWEKWEKKGMRDPEFSAAVLETNRLVHEIERLRRKLAELETFRPVIGEFADTVQIDGQGVVMPDDYNPAIKIETNLGKQWYANRPKEKQ